MRVNLPPKTVTAYAVVTVVAAALGLWLGQPHRKARERPPSPAQAPADTAMLQKWRAWHDSLAQQFTREVVGIKVGEIFPGLVLSAPTDDGLYSIPDVLPSGGVIALVTAVCDKCIETAVALQVAVDSAGSAAIPTVLLADALPGLVPFAEDLARRGVRLPVFCDRERALRERHNVQGTMPWFRLDARNRLVSFGFVFEPRISFLRGVISGKDALGAHEGNRELCIREEGR